MNIEIEKKLLMKRILEINSEELISKLNSIINDEKGYNSLGFQTKDIDFWDTTPDEIKLEVEKAIEEIENGQFVAHEDVMKNYAKWLKK
jgi:hypothetical protein